MSPGRVAALSSTRRLWPSLELRGIESLLLPKGYRLLPLVRQRYEFELASVEARVLSPEEVIRRSAYIMSVNGCLTNLFKIAQAAPSQVSPDASETRKRFFEANRFAVGYATHGLFPYRGKFHPQMIRAIINVIGMKPGELLLDPMVGSGTTSVEASLMGIRSIGIELNPFTVFMSKAKLSALDMDTHSFPLLLENADQVFLFLADGRLGGDFIEIFEKTPELFDLVRLCYLDALGYARRRKTRTASQLFPDLLRRYLDAVASFNVVRRELNLDLGEWHIYEGDARALSLGATVDGIVFSPPYSFALDYIENDRSQLEYLGVNVEALKKNMVGLREEDGEGKDRVSARVEPYFQDMLQILGQCHRVLKSGRFCVVIIGSNTRQTGGIRLEEKLTRLASQVGFVLSYHMVRDIEGIRNTMLEEHVLFFGKP